MSLGISGAVWGGLAAGAVSAVANRGTNAAAANANNAAASAATTQAQIAQDQYSDWKTDFLPLQHGLVDLANKAGSQQQYDTASEKANADVTQAYDRAGSELRNRLNSYGVDPGSSKYAASFSRFGLGEAKDAAGAQMQARQGVTDRANALKMDVYSLGKGIPGTAMAGLSSAAGSNLAVANSLYGQASRNAQGIGVIGQKLGPALSDFWKTPGFTSGPGGNTNTGWSNDYTSGAMGP